MTQTLVMPKRLLTHTLPGPATVVDSCNFSRCAGKDASVNGSVCLSVCLSVAKMQKRDFLKTEQ